jgi:transposase
MKQYSVDLRERLLQVVDAGLSQAEATRLLGVSTATLQRWRQQQRQTGSVAPRPRSGRPRAIDRAPRNHGPNLTLLAALTPQGMGPAMVVEGGADHAACATYITQALVPSLRPGQVVIMDRLNVHTGASIRASIEAAGCELRLLPAYSPDFNPIEQAFAKIKTHLRSAEARTFPALVRAIGTALDRITPADACHCYTHCGYPLSARFL